MPTRKPKKEDMCKYRQQGVECRAEEHDTEWCKYFCGWNPKVEHELIEADRKRHEKWLRGSTGV
jgi:hypothetical protein